MLLPARRDTCHVVELAVEHRAVVLGRGDEHRRLAAEQEVMRIVRMQRERLVRSAARAETAKEARKARRADANVQRPTLNVQRPTEAGDGRTFFARIFGGVSLNNCVEGGATRGALAVEWIAVEAIMGVWFGEGFFTFRSGHEHTPSD